MTAVQPYAPSLPYIGPLFPAVMTKFFRFVAEGPAAVHAALLRNVRNLLCTAAADPLPADPPAERTDRRIQKI